jgi:hypothetical protein
MAYIYLVEDNTAPTIDLTLKRDGTVINLTNATSVILTIQNRETAAITNTGHQTCAITGLLTGQVQYAIQAVDFPTKGAYLGEIKITYTTGEVEILYEQLHVTVRKKIA